MAQERTQHPEVQLGLALSRVPLRLFEGADYPRRGPSPEDRIVSLPNNPEFGKQLNDKLDAIKPPVSFQVRNTPIVRSQKQGFGVVPVRIPAGQFARAVTKGGAPPTFYRRGDGGKATLVDYYEVRDRRVTGADQHRKLRMLRLELKEFCAQAQRIPAPQPEYQRPFTWRTPERFDATTVKALLVDTMGKVTSKTRQPSNMLC